MTSKAPGRAVFSLVAACVAGFGLTACNEDPAERDSELARGNTAVYGSRGRLQCDFGPGITPQQSEMKLIQAGVDVLQSGCGVMTDVAFPAVCGGGTGELLLHEIRKENLDTAESMGFHSVANLKTVRSKGYEWVDCEAGVPLP